MMNIEIDKQKIKIGLIVLLAVILTAIIIAIGMFTMNSTSHTGGNSNLNAETYDFTFKFLKLTNKKENMIYSPLSIKYALNMLKEGANGNTKSQIENLIDQESLTEYNNIDKVLSLANGVYIRDTYAKEVKENYIKTLEEKYNAEINYDSFNSANNINKWIENKTIGIIKNIIQDDTVHNQNLEMILINALAIDMDWKAGFNSERTDGEEFYLENGSKVVATTMNMETSGDSVSYYTDREVTVVAMELKEYNNTQIEFVAIMPNGKLSNYIPTFTEEELNRILKKSKLASKTKNGVEISIPRFSFDYDLKLKDELLKLGITDVFDPNKSDLTNIVNTGLYVSDVLHKANIEFTEKGIKAAAVTVIYATDGMVPWKPQPLEININKPFLYVIRDKNTGEIWFVGTVYEPNLWKDDMESYK